MNFSEDPAERLTLEEFVKLCQEATGLNFTYNEQTQTNLSAGRVVMFGPKRRRARPRRDRRPAGRPPSGALPGRRNRGRCG